MRAPEFKIAQTVKIAGKGFLNLETHFLTKNWGPAYAVAIASLQYLYLSLPQALSYYFFSQLPENVVFHQNSIFGHFWIMTLGQNDWMLDGDVWFFILLSLLLLHIIRRWLDSWWLLNTHRCCCCWRIIYYYFLWKLFIRKCYPSITMRNCDLTHGRLP